MFTIADGKRKFIYNYKVAESIISKSPKYKYPNYITSYYSFFHDNPDTALQLKLSKSNYDKEKPSPYFINKNKQLQKLKKQVQTKRLDVLINKALEKSNTIRNYSHNYKINKNNKNTKEKNMNKTLFRFPKIKLDYNTMSIPRFSKNRIKENIMNRVNHFFPDRYFNDKEINDGNNTNTDKTDWKKNLEYKKKLEEYKKLYSIKYISPGPVIQENKELKLKKKAYKLIGPAITIYNKKNKNKLFNNVSKDEINKKIDVGLNTIPYIC